MYWALYYICKERCYQTTQHLLQFSKQKTRAPKRLHTEQMLQDVQLRPVVYSVKLLIPVCKRNEIQSFLYTYAEQHGSDLCLTIGQSQLYLTTNPHLQHNGLCKKIIQKRKNYLFMLAFKVVIVVVKQRTLTNN